MQLVTWNINSLRLRMPHLARLTAERRPHVICLQETKVPNPLFPHEEVRQLGYAHLHYQGMKGYNGVAILSRLPLRAVEDLPLWCGRSDCRHVAADVETGSGAVRVHNFYVPAGGDIPDPLQNEKFAHKLGFIEETAAWFRKHPPRRSVLVGDLNIAPLAHDVWSHKQLLKIVSHTPPETERLLAWMEAGFQDAMRHFIPEPTALFTWWSYRNRDWRKSNRGRRLDHIWLTPDLLPALTDISVLKDVRDWERPSDHVPVCATLAL
ncbi:exodeoxyribonuclease III [Oecophyllibacter saccharovorans]|uniref:Exodeoxyribonuclease III n=1 Tax=Oecophyllibacter saccharovorans TaxID=2558360 RepID=A0A506UQC6_9PROT|nr:exodeoxyribonuclease III [Oecophyllibacter saccharovorans]TPW35547.1 exodeoxyribonuclease III [Oecophyllibacter saccharovorans]